ncbi:Fur family transcriptional regulator [Thermococcus radiotolerans]|uniref:Fur family transcriptional regulator n=1 Tax=Thermococcus radiotolerans TaxID=187880 RepID=A0A2Z2MVL1_9EURY|nr:Fur family transcriptional regulator [Thermococcus radiotolerans]ASJ13888.1 Fur family transcriptional regulator [Thermococcus radiotolerans]
MWKEKAIERLKESGYKLTPQRLKLVEILDRIGDEHPSLKDILNEIKAEFPTMSFSTLYSNVLTLRELGLLELFSLDGETRVELNTEPHINLISGGKVIDFNDPEIIERIREKTGRNVKLVNVLVE